MRTRTVMFVIIQFCPKRYLKNETVNSTIWRRKSKIYVKLDRLMSKIIDFADANNSSTIMYYLIRKKGN
jgi:hypothetical protein